MVTNFEKHYWDAYEIKVVKKPTPSPYNLRKSRNDLQSFLTTIPQTPLTKFITPSNKVIRSKSV